MAKVMVSLPDDLLRGAGEGDAARFVTTLLLDASVLLAAFDPEGGHHESARALLEDENATLATRDLARYEVANVAVRAWRAPKAVAPLLAAIEKLADDGGVLASTDTLLMRAAEIAQSHTISAYVVAADGAGHRLISCDKRDKDIQTTFNVYGHLLPSVHEALGASLDAAYEGSTQPDNVVSL